MQGLKLEHFFELNCYLQITVKFEIVHIFLKNGYLTK